MSAEEQAADIVKSITENEEEPTPAKKASEVLTHVISKLQDEYGVEFFVTNRLGFRPKQETKE